jgi:cell division protease FtsH
MSDAIGPVAVTDGRQDGPLLPGVASTSESTQELVDQEVRRIIDDAEHDVLLLLERERERLDRLTHTLLERETLDGPEAYEAAGLPVPQMDPAEEARATADAPIAAESAADPTPS